LSSSDADAGDTATYSLVSGNGDADNASFSITGGQLVTTFAANFATKATYNVRVRATDAGTSTSDQTFIVTVLESVVTPATIMIDNSTINENAAANSIVGLLDTNDPDTSAAYTYSLASGEGGTDNGSFSIDSNGLLINASPNFETKSTYNVRVQAAKTGSPASFAMFVITITNVDEAPTTLTISSSNIPNGSPAAFIVGALGNDDPDAGSVATYSFVSGAGDTDNGAFNIVNGNLVTDFVADAVVQSTYTVRVAVTTDGTTSVQRVLTLNVTSAT